MNNRYKVYTDLDSCMDVRYGILSKLLAAKGADFETTFADTYDKRIIDKFERPNLGIKQADFDEAFANRNVNDLHWYKPSNLISSMLGVLVDMEQIAGKLMEIRGIDLTVNIWPYEFDDELRNYLHGELSKITGVESVEISFTPFKDITMSSLNGFTHVLSYYILNGKEYEQFQMTIGKPHNPDLKCAVPCINTNEDEITKLMSPESIRLISGILLANSITLTPINPNVYDYKKDK